MKVVSLDVHREASQMFLSDENGEVLLGMPVRIERQELRSVIAGIPGEKHVIFEEGPLPALIKDALEGGHRRSRFLRSSLQCTHCPGRGFG